MKNIGFFIKNIFICICIVVFVSVMFVTVSHDNSYSFHKKYEENDVKAYAVMEKNSGRILYASNENEKLAMASTTKIITAICVIENNKNLDKVIKIPLEAEGVEGSSIYLRSGEHLSIISLLYGLMLQSGNDAAVALAIETSGSVEKFMELCNNFVKRIGANNTNVITPHGLHHKDHYTTAYDLALISCYAMKNPIFKKIVGTKKIVIPNEYEEDPRLLKNKNKMLTDVDDATGVKTGYTKKAGRCLVSSAEKGKMEVICVVLNCNKMFEISKELLEEAFKEYRVYEIVPSYNHLISLPVLSSETKEVNLYTKESFFYPLRPEEIGQISTKIILPHFIEAPVQKNQLVGEYQIFLQNHLLFSAKIFTIEDAKSNNFKYIVKNILQRMF